MGRCSLRPAAGRPRGVHARARGCQSVGSSTFVFQADCHPPSKPDASPPTEVEPAAPVEVRVLARARGRGRAAGIAAEGADERPEPADRHLVGVEAEAADASPARSWTCRAGRDPVVAAVEGRRRRRVNGEARAAVVPSGARVRAGPAGRVGARTAARAAREGLAPAVAADPGARRCRAPHAVARCTSGRRCPCTARCPGCICPCSPR